MHKSLLSIAVLAALALPQASFAEEAAGWDEGARKV